MRIGVFDSGIGGKAVAESLIVDFPNDEVMYVNDTAHIPYGGRTQQDIITLTEAAIQPLIEAHCDVIVLACNTATAAAIEYLRGTYPNTPFVGLEPMVKPAATLTTSKVIAVFATPFTLQSTRYTTLKQQFAQGVKVLEPDCSDWATMIEHNELSDDRIETITQSVVDQNADVIVLACTHYHWIEDKIREIAGDTAVIIDPTDAISHQVHSLLA